MLVIRKAIAAYLGRVFDGDVSAGEILKVDEESLFPGSRHLLEFCSLFVVDDERYHQRRRVRIIVVGVAAKSHLRHDRSAEHTQTRCVGPVGTCI